MSLTYPCIYHENGLCRKYKEPGYVSHCVFGPCKAETPSRADLLRRMEDEALGRFLYKFMQLEDGNIFCQNKPECSHLLDTPEGIPERWCIACMIHWLRQPADEGSNANRRVSCGEVIEEGRLMCPQCERSEL